MSARCTPCTRRVTLRLFCWGAHRHHRRAHVCAIIHQSPRRVLPVISFRSFHGDQYPIIFATRPIHVPPPRTRGSTFTAADWISRPFNSAMSRGCLLCSSARVLSPPTLARIPRGRDHLIHPPYSVISTQGQPPLQVQRCPLCLSFVGRGLWADLHQTRVWLGVLNAKFAAINREIPPVFLLSLFFFFIGFSLHGDLIANYRN